MRVRGLFRLQDMVCSVMHNDEPTAGKLRNVTELIKIGHNIFLLVGRFTFLGHRLYYICDRAPPLTVLCTSYLTIISHILLSGC